MFAREQCRMRCVHDEDRSDFLWGDPEALSTSCVPLVWTNVLLCRSF